MQICYYINLYKGFILDMGLIFDMVFLTTTLQAALIASLTSRPWIYSVEFLPFLVMRRLFYGDCG